MSKDQAADDLKTDVEREALKALERLNTLIYLLPGSELDGTAAWSSASDLPRIGTRSERKVIGPGAGRASARPHVGEDTVPPVVVHGGAAAVVLPPGSRIAVALGVRNRRVYRRYKTKVDPRDHLPFGEQLASTQPLPRRQPGVVYWQQLRGDSWMDTKPPSRLSLASLGHDDSYSYFAERIHRRRQPTRMEIEALGSAGSVLGDKAWRKRACNGLVSVSGDAKEVMKQLITVAIPAGAIATVTTGAAPLAVQIFGKAFTPLTIAILAIVLARMGVAALCHD